jgi:hypothetical protein
MRFVEVISHPQPCPITEPAIGQPLLGINRSLHHRRLLFEYEATTTT